jgi:hypothetical protein
MCETGTGQQVAQLLDSYFMMMMMMIKSVRQNTNHIKYKIRLLYRHYIQFNKAAHAFPVPPVSME